MFGVGEANQGEIGLSSNRSHPNDERITKVLQRHFPDSKIWKGELIFFTPEMLLAGELHPLRHKLDLKQIDDFGKAVSKLWDSYAALSFQAKKALGAKYRGDVDISKVDIEPFQRIRHNTLRELVALHRAVHGTNPTRYEDVPGATTDQGMIEPAKSQLLSYAKIAERGVTESRDQKAHLVQIARDAWERYKGKRAPKKSDASPFTDFVADVIVLAGKEYEEGWMAETVMGAWRDYDSNRGR